MDHQCLIIFLVLLSLSVRKIASEGDCLLSKTEFYSFNVTLNKGNVCLILVDQGNEGMVPRYSQRSVEYMDLSNNKYSNFSMEFWGIERIKVLNLSHNLFNGSLPMNFTEPNIIKIFPDLKVLDLSHNNFSGELPERIGHSSMQLLNLSFNHFIGPLPKALLEYSTSEINGKLVTLDLAGMGLSGNLPNFSRLTSLAFLNFSGNKFNSSWLHVLNVSSLEVVDLSNNDFTDAPLFNASSSATKLKYLDLSRNQMNSSFPDLEDQSNLEYLNLAHNQLSGPLPKYLGDLSQLKVLDLSFNYFNEQIPRLSNLTYLTVLDLSNNQLIGSVPELNFTNLKVLNLSNNRLNGQIPDALLQKLQNVSSYDFSNNNISLCFNINFPFLRDKFAGNIDCPIATTAGTKSKSNAKLALAVALPICVLLIGAVFCVWACRKRAKLWARLLSNREEPHSFGPFEFQTETTSWVAKIKDPTSAPVIIFDKPLLDFTFADLLSATSCFNREALLTEGRFGIIYSGHLPGNLHVAIKVLVTGSSLTNHEVKSELERLGQIKHPNLVPVIGYCLAGSQKIILSEYMENGSLEHLLSNSAGNQESGDWSNDKWDDNQNMFHNIPSIARNSWKFRHGIALGTARGLSYLHHGCSPQIVHRDIKASSIYLDSEFEPRLSDFGLARLVGSNFGGNTTRRPQGYTPPELSPSNSFTATPESDVYEFGVVLFQLITGKKPLGDKYPGEEDPGDLVSWVRGLVKNDKMSQAIDSNIKETGPSKDLEEALKIGYLCTAEIPSKRPTMQQIVGLLKDIKLEAEDEH